MIRRVNSPGGDDPSPRRRLSVLLAALVLVVLQVVAVSHLIGHSASGDTGHCELCLNAVHGGAALVASAIPAPTFHGLTGRLILAPELRVSTRAPTVCRARGPPSFA